MIKSMTAYGRAESCSDIGKVIVEIQTVNRKYLEIQTNLPKGFLYLDNHVRKWVGNSLYRGQVYVAVEFIPKEGQALFAIHPNTALAKELKQAWSKLASSMDIAVDSMAYSEALSRILINEKVYMQDSLKLKDETAIADLLHDGITSALDSLITMRLAEGANLAKDIRERLINLECTLTQVEGYNDEIVSTYRDKLKDKIAEYMTATAEDNERLLKEVVIYADKVDITEEKVRLSSHIKQSLQLIQSPDAVGKTLDFLIKEMQRELHTMVVKSPHIAVNKLLIEAKGEVEKIREQVQNIE